MIKILFVCLGNICRSPMAEYVLRDMAERAGLASELEIASAATSDEENGNPVYPPARAMLASHGIDCKNKRARQMTRADGEYYDLLIGMDFSNIAQMRRCFKGHEGKIHLLCKYAGRPGEGIADPWYTGNFDDTWRDVNAGCAGLLRELFGVGGDREEQTLFRREI